MRRAIVGAAVLAAVCWAVWAGFATFAAPSETKPTEQDVQAAEAIKPPPPVKVKAEPVTFRRTYKPPRAAMAAKSACALTTAWKFDLNFPHADIHLVSGLQNSGLSGSGMGVAGRLVTLGIDDATAHEHEGDEWRGIYLNVRVELDAPGLVTSNKAFSLWLRDVSGPPSPHPPPTYTVITSLPATEFTCSLSGVYLNEERTHNPPADRQLMDPTDSTCTETWVAEEGATASISALCPDGSTISASGTLGDAGGEVDIGADYGITFAFTIQSMPTAGVVEGIASGIAWDATSIDGGTIELYNPGDDAPDSGQPNWGRTKTTTACKRVSIAGSQISMWREGGSDSLTTWDGDIWAPYIVSWHPLDGKFDAAGPSYDITYSSNAITYTDESTYTVDTFSTNYGPVVQCRKSWLALWEYQKLSSTAIQVRETSAWRTANNEAVGDTTETQNDQRAHLCMWGLQATGRVVSPHWSSGFGFSLASSIDINDTQGLPARASPWVGGAGVTVDPGDNDLWTVAAGASAPAVTRTMATRYWLRMDRLASGYTPGLEYHPDWPIMLKANLPILTTEDDPDWWDSGLGGVDSEDITNWANRRYLLLGINAARAGTVRLTVTYKVPHTSDPCYTCAEHRWGEWSYTTTTYTRSYDVAIEAGANSKLIDLVLNREKSSVTGSYRMHQVTSVSIALPANPSGSPEAYTLTGLALVLDPGETGRDEPATHSAFRFVPSWAWIGTRWFGYGGWVDGKDALELEYGYSSQHYETKLAYIAHSAHCPESELTSRLDAAKALGRLYNELSWQEGFTPSWPTPTPENNSNNKDADDAQVDSSLYWWDLHQSTESITLSNLEVALCAGTYNIAAGVPYTLYHYKYPRGALHGIAVNSAYTAVQRNATNLIDVYQSLGGTTKVDQLETDEHGRYRFDEGYEKTALYRLDGGGELTGWLPVANREYTTAIVEWALRTPAEPYIDMDELGVTWLVTEQGGALRVYYLDARETPPRVEVTQPTTGIGYSRPSIAVRGGELLVAATDASAGNTLLWSSYDRGETWAAVATDLGTGITLGTVAVRPGTGEVLLTGIDASDNVVLRMASGTDLPRDDLTLGVDEITIAAATAGARSTCQAHPDGSLIAAVQGATGVDFYRCRNLATGFAAV